MGTSICSVNYFCFGALLIFVGTVLLCALGFTIVLPYQATRDWPETTCFLVNVSYHQHICSCDRQPTFDIEEFDSCVGKYPCLQIYVRFSIQMPNSEKKLHTNETDMENTYWNVLTQVTPIHGKTKRKSGVLPEENGTRKGSLGEQELLENTTDYEVYSAETQTTETSFLDKRLTTLVNETASAQALFRKHSVNGMPINGSDSLLESNKTHAKTESLSTQKRFETDAYSLNNRESASSSISKDSMDVNGGKMITTLLFRSWSDAFYKQCTLYECGDQQWNRQESSRYRKDYGKHGANYTCYIDPGDPSRVILEKTPRVYMLHAVFWSCLCLSVGTFLWLGLCFGCWKLDSETEAEKYRNRYGALK